MLFLLCTAGVEIMRHSSVAARAPQQTHTVCIRYLRFCKGIGERCTQPDANFDRGKNWNDQSTWYMCCRCCVYRAACVEQWHCIVLGSCVVHLPFICVHGWAGEARDLGNLDREEWQMLGEIIMRVVNWNAVWWPFFSAQGKKNLTFDQHIPLTPELQPIT